MRPDPAVKLLAQLRLPICLPAPQQPCQTVRYGCPFLYSINGINGVLPPEIFPEIFTFNGLMSRMFVKAITM